MFVVLRRTAMSAIIYEVLDAGTAVTDAGGRLVSSGAGIPSFVGVLDKAVRRIVELNEDVSPGDVFVTNDPAFGGVTHLNDVVLALPVFAGDKVPGSVSTEATEIFQEGLRLPAVKLIAAGEPIESVFRIVEANSRLPEYLWAGVAAVRIGGRRLEELVARVGLETFLAALHDFMVLGGRGDPADAREAAARNVRARRRAGARPSVPRRGDDRARPLRGRRARQPRIQ